MTDILAISHAASTAINRSIYIELQKLGCAIELVVPKQLNIGGNLKLSDPKREQDPIIYFEELIGTNPRIYTYDNLIPLLNKVKPRFVILDNDPISKLANTVGTWCKQNKAILICQSCENLPNDLVSHIKRMGLKSLPAALFKWYFKLLNRSLIDCVFTINSDGTHIFKEMGFKKVVQIPLGFDPNVFFPNKMSRNEIRLNLNIHDNTPVIAYFGRLTQEKGVHVLVECLAQLKNENWVFMIDNFELYKTPYTNLIKELIAKKGIAEKIIFIDADHLEIANYMNAADVVVIPSISTPNWKEQYGRVAPEAMACGKVVCVSDSGALKELVGNAGVIVPEGDIDALKSFLLNCMNTPSKFEAMKMEAAIRASDFLSVQKQAEIIFSTIKFFA